MIITPEVTVSDMCLLTVGQLCNSCHVSSSSSSLSSSSYYCGDQSNSFTLIKGSKERCLLGQNTACEFSGSFP